ncbi:MAG: 16S rRNA (guanine(966)-N(2))-methyltransferase RsmD [Clostridia bacterium]|nr:16S rRNA (guanine(966)-N(2))-methyltransferase RsmD [Clostridia bacterium]
MRIIAGKHRGRVLKEFKGRQIRPTADRAKEAIFNILQTDIYGSAFLDLYSGTGNMGIEALSRGAESAVLVDSSKESVAIMQFNADLIKENAEVVYSDALTYVLSTRKKFDIIFLDPPYDIDGTPVLKAIAQNKILNYGGIIIYEHSEDFKVQEIEELEHFSTRKYGVAHFEFYGERK